MFGGFHDPTVTLQPRGAPVTPLKQEAMAAMALRAATGAWSTATIDVAQRW